MMAHTNGGKYLEALANAPSFFDRVLSVELAPHPVPERHIVHTRYR